MKDLFPTSIRSWLVFRVERFLVRGTHYRFLFVVAAIGLVSLIGGLSVTLPGLSDEGLGSEVWWAFLRLSDPGYLGDDQGTWRRVVSTILTVLGYVIFLGAMVAILTTWLNELLATLERGLTPVRMRGHIAILGWTPGTRAICRNLVLSEVRLGRWLELQGIRRLRIAILTKRVGPERVAELRDALRDRYRRNQIVLRSGSALRATDLVRVDVKHAATVVIPGLDSASAAAEDYDAVVLKTLRLLDGLDDNASLLPACVCEVLDPRRIPLALRAYRGSLEVVASDVFVGRLLAYSVREPGLGAVGFELLTHELGATLYVDEWVGGTTTAGEIQRHSPRAILVGAMTELARGYSCRIALDPQREIRDGTTLVWVATGYTQITPAASPSPEPSVPNPLPQVVVRPGKRRRLLIMGWSRRVPDLLTELARRPNEHWEVDVLAAVDTEVRQGATADLSLNNGSIRHIEGDQSIPSALAELQPHTYDRIVMVASDWLATGEESDARTIAGFLGLQEVIGDERPWPPVVAEVLGASNGALFDPGRVHVVASPQLVSHAVSQVVLRRELLGVIDELFGPGEADVMFVGLTGDGELAFDIVAAAVQRQRDEPTVAIGIRRGGRGGEVMLAPDPKTVVRLSMDELVVMRRVGIRTVQPSS